MLLIYEFKYAMIWHKFVSFIPLDGLEFSGPVVLCLLLINSANLSADSTLNTSFVLLLIFLLFISFLHSS